MPSDISEKIVTGLGLISTWLAHSAAILNPATQTITPLATGLKAMLSAFTTMSVWCDNRNVID